MTAGRISLNSETLERAASLIRAGELVAFPTETVYGLGANALDPGAVEKIYLVKGRPSTSPVIVHVASLEMARTLVRDWPRQAQVLAERWWPGPLTLVLPKQPAIPDIVTAGLDTVGVRMPAHPMALELIRAAGVPIAAPSANRFTELSPTTAGHVRESLGAAVQLILDGGPTTVGIESTVLSLVGQRPLLLRPGMVTQKDIEALTGPVQVAGRIENGHPRAHPSPGMQPRHYSPRTPLLLVESAALPAEGRGACLWMRRPAAASKSVPMPADAAAYAVALYDTLHRLDEEGWDWIAVERPPEDPQWAAINDRLQRAASPLSA